MPKEIKQKESLLININLIDMINNINNMDENTTIWLKPYGSQGREITKDLTFTNNEDARFSKKMPSGIKINDILIVYGVGPTKILAIYKVTSHPLKVFGL